MFVKVLRKYLPNIAKYIVDTYGPKVCWVKAFNNIKYLFNIAI